jgi:hypothetical protein
MINLVEVLSEKSKQIGQKMPKILVGLKKLDILC